MLKLYECVDGKVTAYHEAWIEDRKVVEHWGEIGTRGESKKHPRDMKADEDAEIRRVLQPAIAKGLVPIDEDDHVVLLVEYAIDGMGTEDDLELRHALESRLNETLGWTGLGHCDGGSIGSGSMEVCCLVVDFAVAQKVIEQDLADTEFAHFTRIYAED